MRAIGYIMICVGVIYILIAFNMDVSVSTSTTYVRGYGSIGGGEVANLDLMERRQNHLIVACLITLLGALFAIFGKDEIAESESIKESAKPESVQNNFEGEPDLSSDPYRLWLAERYDIARNEIFQRFVIADQTFETLDQALAFADSQEVAKRAQIEEEESRKRAEEEAKALEAQMLAEQSQEEWEKNKPKVIAAGAVGVVIVFGLIYFSIESPEEREARLAAEAAEAEAELALAEAEIGVSLPEDVRKVEFKQNSDALLCSVDSIEAELPAEARVTRISFDTTMDAAQLKARFVEAFGEGQAGYKYLDGDGDDWLWSLEDRIISLNHMNYGGGTEKIVCLISKGTG